VRKVKKEELPDGLVILHDKHSWRHGVGPLPFRPCGRLESPAGSGSCILHYMDARARPGFLAGVLRSSRMRALDAKLQAIAGDAVRMLSMVRESCQLARLALIDGEPGAAELCAENDVRIDALMAKLERSILAVIAREQPVAGNLRFLGATFRALADIERAGDYAVHVACTGAELAAEPPLKPYTDTRRILMVLDAMIEETIRAFLESDAEAARQALAMDDEIDELYEHVQRELLTHALERPETVAKAIKLMNVGRYLERLGDHLENVNEHTIFWLTGKRL